ncbi:hypothetical protein SS50377_25300 [Spironucleus salmonicida]|uniref:Nucleolar protein 14 n=1 Tax=Spironucleus salmonicida TaxID=348837 RepID=V6LM80_9EUKA|nr:hypothetical protein SS50377_25300 [Spironucleus salmonicida]|eukprot:EST41819.1 hypothetical protein SS50377_18653 [Spironucleus salmonicida]
MAKPTKQNMNARLEQARSKLKINAPNPFDIKKSHTHQKVLNKIIPYQHAQKSNTQQSKQQPQKPQTQQLTFVQDDTQKSSAQIQSQIAEFVLQKQEATQHFKISETDKIYQEIQEKSKHFREEKKQTKLQVEKKIYQLDKISQQLKDILPQREVSVNQRHNDDISGLVAANKGQITHDDAVRAGAARLIELQRNTKTQKINYDLGDDEVDMEEFRAGTDNESEQIEESSESQKLEDISIQEIDTAEGSSAYLQSLPFIIQVPGNYSQFGILLNRARNSEEIVVMDRLIKTNSTLNDKNNAPAMEKLSSFVFKRFIEINDLTRKDCCMRCFRHITYELPSHCAGLLLNYLNQYKTLQAVQISLVLRLINICYIQTDFSSQKLNNLFSMCFLVSENILLQPIKTTNQLMQSLFFVSQVACLSINCYRYNSSVLRFCQNVLTFIEYQSSIYLKECNTKFDLRVLMSTSYKQEVSQEMIVSIVQTIVKVYQSVFQINIDFVPSILQQFCQNTNTIICLDYIKEKPVLIQQLEPLYAQSYDYKKDLSLDRTKARAKALEKAEKRVQKDTARKVLKEKRQEVVMRQHRMKERSERINRIKSIVNSQYDQQTHDVKNLVRIEKKSRGKK